MEWPLLEQWQSEGVLAPLDLHFARRTAHYAGGIDEVQAAVVAATMAAARQGHLCLYREALPTLFPLSLQEFLERGFSSSEYEWKKLTAFLYRNEERFYLPKNWELEQELLFHLKRLSRKRTLSALPQFPLQARLNEEQNQAVETVWQHTVNLVSGGPGTGKTFTAAAITQAFSSAKKIILAAPTARAADHLKKSMLNCGIASEVLQEASTLHKLLRYKSKPSSTLPWLNADLILVDESSMIDAPLFVALLAALPESSTLVLMGDPDQLHPVGIGSLFSDLVSSHLPFPIGKARLVRCLRVEDRPLLELASALQNSVDCKWPLLDWAMDAHSPDQFYKKIWELSQSFWLMPTVDCPKREKLLAMLQRFRILSVLRQGPFGTDAINTKLAGFMQAEAKVGEYWITPIQILRNDAATGLCNGELGVLVQPKSPLYSSRSVDGYAVFASHEAPLKAAILPTYEYAFCSSVHKSQGSEYEEVLLIAPPGSESFGKEMLYTAVTRAKKKLSVVSTPEILAQMQKNHLRKQSGLFASSSVDNKISSNDASI